jgi:hypothetical protein
MLREYSVMQRYVRFVNGLGPVILVCGLILYIAACARPPSAPVEDLSGHDNLTAYQLAQVRGTRDGDRLKAEARFADGASALVVEMQFAIGSPTTLSAGTWHWTRDGSLAQGTVAGRSVMFLGGQDGPPSIGGRFDLLDANGVAKYRVTIPTTELKTKLPLP